jgi:hypothetical protein
MTIGRLDAAGGDELVEEQAGLVALAEAEPADARRQALEAEAGGAALVVSREQGVGVGVAGEDPAAEAFGAAARGLGLIGGEELQEFVVGDVDVARVAGEGDPAERATPDAELGADEGGYESREVEGVLVAPVVRTLADVIAVVEGDAAAALQLDHGADVPFHAGQREIHVVVGVRGSCFLGLLQAVLDGDVSLERIVGAGLIGEDIRGDASEEEPFEQFDGVAVDADGAGVFLSGVFGGSVDGVVDLRDDLVEVAVGEAPFEA